MNLSVPYLMITESILNNWREFIKMSEKKTTVLEYIELIDHILKLSIKTYEAIKGKLCMNENLDIFMETLTIYEKRMIITCTCDNNKKFNSGVSHPNLGSSDFKCHKEIIEKCCDVTISDLRRLQDLYKSYNGCVSKTFKETLSTLNFSDVILLCRILASHTWYEQNMHTIHIFTDMLNELDDFIEERIKRDGGDFLCV
jgi:hypothetical protein